MYVCVLTVTVQDGQEAISCGQSETSRGSPSRGYQLVKMIQRLGRVRKVSYIDTQRVESSMVAQMAASTAHAKR